MIIQIIKKASKLLKNLNHTNEYVVEYISKEVFNLLEADIKDFLLKTSILNTLNSSLCDEVAGKNAVEDNIIMVGDSPVRLNSDVFIDSPLELIVINLILSYANKDFQTALEYGKQAVDGLSCVSFIKCMPYKILWQIYCTLGIQRKPKIILTYM